MGMKISRSNALEYIAILVCIGVGYKVFEQSVLEHHFIIPTQILAIAVLIGNFVYYSFKGHVWAKIILFWLFVLADFCAFLSLFYSPMLARNSEFMPGVVAIVGILTFLLYVYQNENKLYKH